MMGGAGASGPERPGLPEARLGPERRLHARSVPPALTGPNPPGREVPMIPIVPLLALLAPVTPPASPAQSQVAVFRGSPANPGSVAVVDVLGQAPLQVPGGLAGVTLLDIDFHGRTELQRFLSGRAQLGSGARDSRGSSSPRARVRSGVTRASSPAGDPLRLALDRPDRRGAVGLRARRQRPTGMTIRSRRASRWTRPVRPARRDHPGRGRRSLRTGRPERHVDPAHRDDSPLDVGTAGLAARPELGRRRLRRPGRALRPDRVRRRRAGLLRSARAALPLGSRVRWRSARSVSTP